MASAAAIASTTTATSEVARQRETRSGSWLPRCDVEATTRERNAKGRCDEDRDEENSRQQKIWRRRSALKQREMARWQIATAASATAEARARRGGLPGSGEARRSQASLSPQQRDRHRTVTPSCHSAAMPASSPPRQRYACAGGDQGRPETTRTEILHNAKPTADELDSADEHNSRRPTTGHAERREDTKRRRDARERRHTPRSRHEGELSPRRPGTSEQRARQRRKAKTRARKNALQLTNERDKAATGRRNRPRRRRTAEDLRERNWAHYGEQLSDEYHEQYGGTHREHRDETTDDRRRKTRRQTKEGPLRRRELQQRELRRRCAETRRREQRIHLPLQQAVLSVQRLPFPARHRGRRHRTDLRRALLRSPAASYMSGVWVTTGE